MTWDELKDFCNSLPAEELKKNVVMWREEESVNDISAMALESDHYIDPEYPENGCFSELDAKSMIEGEEETFPNGLDSLKKVYEKGHPVLLENF